MKVVVGVRADDPGDDALACAEALSRRMRAVLVLVHVRPAPWRSGGDDAVDAEWRAYLVEQSRTTLERARRRLEPTTEHELHDHTGASPGRALAEVADAVGASLVVVGSGSQRRDGVGLDGRVLVGPTADQLLHSAALPVLVVPHGYRRSTPAEVPARVTVAYTRSLDSDEALRAAVQLGRRTGAPLRLVTLVVRPPRLLPSYSRALDELRAQARAWLDEAAAEAPLTTHLTAEVSEGEDVDEAMGLVELDPAELLVCGSGAAGPLRRVFLGDTAQRIMRLATAPVVVVPRHAEPGLERTGAIPRVV